MPKPETVVLTSAQATKVMAVWVLLRDGELTLTGEDAELARAAIKDASEEIALQLGGMA